ncbi:DEAD/DEAH box helicase family protein [Methylorubrum extorquens]|uniref:DEAD/DEAH box helicase family protein n=1 Tax=Methylorubrum extorquens TaxID=408 RepID=UPI001EE54046|nr:DEAD/DEAH box helicase family protein [Methylorubrum extorquens]MCG5248416.1 DEAD/DEAH box helicase family protein [Methylorubrum extorquens]
MLRDLPLKAVYESETDDLLRDFYIPTLFEAKSYDRAVGFFSGAMLSYAAQGLSAFVRSNGGVMRLVVGGELDDEDVDAIRQGYGLREVSEKVGRSMVEEIDRIEDDLFHTRVELLSWLVAAGRLDVKVALKRRGMFHSKIGVLRDAAGDAVVFQGSANETVYALLPDFNYESMNVFPSWNAALADHLTPHVNTFERLWGNKSTKALVLPFPDAARDRLIRIAKRAKAASPEIEEAVWRAAVERYADEGPAHRTPRLPDVLGGRSFAIMPHQKRALEAWHARGCRAILALATGSGKTITAAYAMVRFFEAMRRLCVVVAVPYQNLADQWVEVLRPFGIHAYACYGGTGRWLEDVSEAVHSFDQGALPFVCLVVVNRTLAGEHFQRVLAKLPGENMLFVGDECHRHAAVAANAALPTGARLRLGLSATPDHYIDVAANARLTDYYGEIGDRYRLREALEDGVLTPYRYHVALVDLTEDETETYGDLSDRIAQQVARSGGEFRGEGDPHLDRLLFERARLLGGAQNKLGALQELLGPEPAGHTLFYCSDATVLVDDEDDGQPRPQRQVEAVSELLQRRRWRNSRFTSRESLRERRGILDRFRLGDIDALVAIRCLDEGIDVPACQRAYILASSRNPRQFIQRRGRILRKAPGKDQAEIFDLMVRIPAGARRGAVERKLLAEEFKRVSEFAGLARNSGEVIETLMPLMREYDLVHHLA